MGNLPVQCFMAKSAPAKIKALLPSLLKPFVWLCVRHGIKFQDIIEPLKTLFIQSTKHSLEQNGHSVTLSRLSVATGLQRKDIKKITEEGTPSKSNLSLLNRIVGQWHHHPDFSKNGVPNPLDCTGPDSDFSNLVKSITTDVNPKTILFELERCNAIKVTKGSALPTSSVLDADGSIDRGLEMLASDCHDLVMAVDSNLFSNLPAPNLHLKTEFDNVSREDIPILREKILDLGTSFHEKIRALLAQYDKDTNPRLYKKVGGARIAVGNYSLIQMGESNNE